MKRFFLVAIVCMAGAAAMHAQEKVPALKVGSEVPVALKSGLVIELNGADGIIIEGKKYPLGMSFGGVMANSGDVSNVIVENADMKIWISDGTLYVESSKQSIGLIQVYSVTGQLVKNINATGQNLVTETLGLARGFYIVKIGAKTYKLMNK